MTAKILKFSHGDDADPLGMVRSALDTIGSEPMRAAVVIFVDQQGKLMWDGAGYTKMEILWALERFKAEILND